MLKEKTEELCNWFKSDSVLLIDKVTERVGKVSRFSHL